MRTQYQEHLQGLLRLADFRLKTQNNQVIEFEHVHQQRLLCSDRDFLHVMEILRSYDVNVYFEQLLQDLDVECQSFLFLQQKNLRHNNLR